MSELENIKPGQPMTEEQKVKLAKENESSTAEAQRLAEEHRQRDVAEGRGEPAVSAVASIIRNKLENDQFEKKSDV